MNCPACGKTTEPDSAFCRFCGHRLEATTSDAEAAALARTNPAGAPMATLGAINDYLKQYGDRPAALHVRLTYLSVMTQVTAASFLRGPTEELTWVDTSRDANAIVDGFPDTLANGPRTNLRIKDPKVRELAAAGVASVRGIFGQVLEQLFEQARKEAEGLLVNGQTRASQEGLTLEAAYREAETYYTAYVDGDLDAALKGFTRLKSMNPADGYFRNVLGAIHSKSKRHMEALKETLYAGYLDPEHPRIAANLMRLLAGTFMFPMALEIAAHYDRYGREPENNLVKLFARLSRVCTAIMVSSFHPPEAFAGDAPDLLDALPPIDRPWLSTPKPGKADQAKPALSRARIFISYRRQGAVEMARRLEATLERRWPGIHVFRDESDEVAGTSWMARIRQEIDAAHAVLVLIHKRWADKRLQDPDDVLRREVAYALQADSILIPLLLDDAGVPAVDKLPEELRPLTEVHARHLRRREFDTDFGLLQYDLGELVAARLARDDAMTRDLDEMEKALQRGEAGDPDVDARIAAQVSELPKYVPGKAAAGQGLRRYDKDGTWEANANLPVGRLTLRFDVSHGNFEGTFEVSGFGGLGRQKTRIEGNCYPILDSQLFLGFQLDGLKNGTEPFQLQIPMHRSVGKHFVGVAVDGVTWTSRNVRPRPHGI